MDNEEIRSMSRKSIRSITKQKSEETAFSALLDKKNKGSKGRTLRRFVAINTHRCQKN